MCGVGKRKRSSPSLPTKEEKRGGERSLVLLAFPSPQPSPRSFLAERGSACVKVHSSLNSTAAERAHFLLHSSLRQPDSYLVKALFRCHRGVIHHLQETVCIDGEICQRPQRKKLGATTQATLAIEDGVNVAFAR